MKLELTLPEFLHFVFHDNEDLYEARRKAARRRPIIAYPGRAIVIDEHTAAQINALDPESLYVYIQVLTDTNNSDPVFLLWRKAEWLESVERQLELRANSQSNREARARKSFAVEWLANMANKLSRELVQPPEKFMVKLVTVLNDSGIAGLAKYVTGVEEILDTKIWIPLSEAQAAEVTLYLQEQKKG